MRFLAVLFLFFYTGVLAQKSTKTLFDGYVSYLNSNTFDSIKNIWSIDNEVYNRLNFSWYVNDNMTFTAQFRNRLIYGNTMAAVPSYGDLVGMDPGFADLSFNLIDEKNLIFNLYIDRLLFNYSKNNLELTMGRQRINWGRTLVWNPNDFFNSYSFFDFNYPEKPGSDAVLVNYYTGPVSSVAAALKFDADKRATAVAKWLVNKWNYDIQLLAGEMNQKDYVAGVGWAGNIWQMGFKGESSLFYPVNPDSVKNRVFSMTASLDYTFDNSLYLLAQVLYTDISPDSPIKDFASYYFARLNAKYLSFTPWNIFAQASYPLTPLLTATFSAMYYPRINGYFINPGLSLSLSDNLEASLIWQFFKGEFPAQITGVKQKQQVNLAFLNFKWNF